jgi:hypothetical protein
MLPDEGGELEPQRHFRDAVFLEEDRGRGVRDHVWKCLAVGEDRGQLDIAVKLAIGDRRRRRIALADRLCPGRSTGEAQDRHHGGRQT